MTQSSRAVLGQPYGLTHDEYVDIFPPASSDAERHPVFVLIHGGEPDQRDEVLSDEEKAEKLTMMVCCSGSRGPKLVLDL